MEILFSDFLGDVLPNVDEANSGYVDGDELSDGEIYKVKRKAIDFRMVLIKVDSAQKVPLERAREISEDELARRLV